MVQRQCVIELLVCKYNDEPLMLPGRRVGMDWLAFNCYVNNVY